MKLLTLIIFVAATSIAGAVDLATQLTVARIDYDLPALETSTGQDALTFRIFVQPALSDESYAVEGALKIPEAGEAGGSLTLIERGSRERKNRVFVLTHSQAQEVYGWFVDAKFLDPTTEEDLKAPVLDGDEMLIEGFVGGRYFRIRRNSGDSSGSSAFFKRVELFRTWKEEPNQQK